MNDPTVITPVRPSSEICRVCENKKGNQVHTVREMLFGTREEFDYLECGSCHCVQILGIPADMNRHYPPGYYSYAEVGDGPPAGTRAAITAGLKWQRRRYVALRRGWLGRVLQTFLPERTQEIAALGEIGVKETSRILDVGCGSGKLLQILRTMGFEDLLGIDPYNKEDFSRNGVTILKRELYEMKGEWDIIMFHHVFEHLPNPEETLRLVRERLVPGGVCLVRIPTVSSWAWKHYGIHWYALDAPRHFFVHSRESMQLLAERVGLCLEKVIYDSTYQQFVGSESYQRNLSAADDIYELESAHLFPPATVRRMKRRARNFNRTQQGDQACFFFRKTV